MFRHESVDNCFNWIEPWLLHACRGPEMRSFPVITRKDRVVQVLTGQRGQAKSADANRHAPLLQIVIELSLILGLVNTVTACPEADLVILHDGEIARPIRRRHQRWTTSSSGHGSEQLLIPVSIEIAPP
jgi:hypothetical protein